LIVDFFQKELIHLKCFSLGSDLETRFYEELIVPFLRRMSNLEELFLNLFLNRNIRLYKSFIDGNSLKNDIINHMPKLNKFAVSIHSNFRYINDSSHLPSNDDIQHTFKGLEDYQIISHIDYLPNRKIGQCHIYSNPYTMNYLYRLTNSFPGGLFRFVRKVSLVDERPFEHEFFIRIAQAFPFLKILIINNQSAQNQKQWQQSNENRSSLPVVGYPHLTILNLYVAHDDYIEQFLVHTKACLSNYIRLYIKYYLLQSLTNNFTRDATRIDCANVQYIYNIAQFDVPRHFHTYFPHIEKL